MRSFQGISNNIEAPIICKVRHSETNNSLYLGSNLSPYGKEKACCELIDPFSYNRNLNNISYFKLQDISVLTSDDIVLLEPTGKCTLLFEKKSNSNALFLTQRCNSNCVMCPQPPGPDNEDYVAIASEIINLLPTETEVLGITGGEPTLVWNDLLKIVKHCNEKIPETLLQLLTNGRLLKTFNKAKELTELSDNIYICIPIYGDVDSVHDKIVQSNGAFYESLNGIFNLARLNVPIEIRIVIIRNNFERLPQLADFIYRNLPFVQHVALMGLEPFGFAEKNINSVWIDPIDYENSLLETVKIFSQREINFSIYNHQLCTVPKSIWKFCKKSISEWKNKYFQDCDACNAKELCGGFFSSSEKIKSKGIKAITYN